MSTLLVDLPEGAVRLQPLMTQRDKATLRSSTYRTQSGRTD